MSLNQITKQFLSIQYIYVYIGIISSFIYIWLNIIDI